MKIGLIGYQGSGKSTLFHWLTGQEPDPAQTHTGQSAMAEIPEPRIDQLVEIYQPKKITRASLELVDTPGLSRTHEGNAQRRATARRLPWRDSGSSCEVRRGRWRWPSRCGRSGGR